MYLVCFLHLYSSGLTLVFVIKIFNDIQFLINGNYLQEKLNKGILLKTSKRLQSEME